DVLDFYSYSTNVTMTKSGTDLVLTDSTLSGQTTIEDFFLPLHQIETINFMNDSVSIDLVETLTSGNDTYTATNLTSPLGIYDNIIYGEYGNDTIHAGDGSDIVWGNYGTDTFYGEDGDDYLFGDFDNDTLYGGNDNDYLSGGDGDDALHGGSGVDTL